MHDTTTGLRVQCLTNPAKLAFACKSETFRSLYSYILLILTKPSKSKKQMNRSLKIPYLAHASLAQLVR